MQKPGCSVCPPSGTQWAPQEEIHLQGVDCGGNLTDFVGKPTQIVQTVPKPGAVQDVKICGEITVGTPCIRALIDSIPIWLDGGEGNYYQGTRRAYQDSCTGEISHETWSHLNSNENPEYPTEILVFNQNITWYAANMVGRIVTAPVMGYCTAREADYYSSDPFMQNQIIGFIKFREIILFNKGNGEVLSTTNQWTITGEQWTQWTYRSDLPIPGLYTCYASPF